MSLDRFFLVTDQSGPGRSNARAPTLGATPGTQSACEKCGWFGPSWRLPGHQALHDNPAPYEVRIRDGNGWRLDAVGEDPEALFSLHVSNRVCVPAVVWDRREDLPYLGNGVE